MVTQELEEAENTREWDVDNVICHITKQRIWLPSSHQPLQLPPTQHSGKGFRILTLSYSGEYQRNDFNDPTVFHFPMQVLVTQSCQTLRAHRQQSTRLVHGILQARILERVVIPLSTRQAPIQRKALNSLTWDFQFSLVNSNLLMFLVFGCCCCKTPIQPGSFQLPLQSSP